MSSQMITTSRGIAIACNLARVFMVTMFRGEVAAPVPLSLPYLSIGRLLPTARYPLFIPHTAKPKKKDWPK